MANTIGLAQNYQRALDSLYRKASLTSSLEVSDDMTRGFDDAGTVQIMDIVTSGLGNYDRTSANSAFPNGSVVVTWTPYTIDNDRAQQFSIDAMDNAEAKQSAFINTSKEFMKQHVVPEVDALRFARMASLGDTTVSADLDAATALVALDVAVEAMDDDNVDQENRTLYVSNELYRHLKNADKITRQFEVSSTGDKVINRDFEEFDGMRIVRVPRGRFYSEITLNDGTGDVWGYEKTAVTGKDINFQIVHTNAVKAITRHAKVRIFNADTNQDADADKYQYRIYHDLIVPKNQTKGIYTHTKA